MTALAIFSRLEVVPTRTVIHRGHLAAGGLIFPCALGRAGVSPHKHEGDGATPAGAFRMVAALYRPDRIDRPRTSLPLTAIRPDSGWCDDPADRAYNKPVRLPFSASHEKLWRKDSVYDVVVVLDYNLDFAWPGKGSAIFLHLAHPDFSPTAGCIAVAPQTMRRLLPRLGPSTMMEVR
jgi:L,D-peptidoglycan transpeptidase YkuD (ErfK/YbiS/YcfS/YnhG family)